jgi:glycosyltransferase involved in cell wall biosynthesis
MTIAFIHDHLSFLPEIEAYRAFFSARGFHVRIMNKKEWQNDQSGIDVEWMMMGFDRSKRTSAIRIHDHASSSTPPFRVIKNRLKAALNTKPDYRLFLNEYVESCFSYNDGVSFGYRDMGIETTLKVDRNKEKAYDFIYTGSVKADRKITNLVNRFLLPDMAGKTLLILSKDYEYIANEYRHNTNIIFKGPVGREELAEYLNRSRFAINYIPDHEPYNRQTSTKFLEYQQFGLPIITTDYPWLRAFERKYGGHFFKTDAALKNLNWEKLLSFSFEPGELRGWTWEEQILGSGVMEFIQNQKSKVKSQK